MKGNGVDMYDLIPDLDKDDIRLKPLSEHIWIGVIEQMFPSPPVPRNRTRCYTKCPVYLFENKRVFSMVNNYESHEMDFYYIPDKELMFIERR